MPGNSVAQPQIQSEFGSYFPIIPNVSRVFRVAWLKTQAAFSWLAAAAPKNRLAAMLVFVTAEYADPLPDQRARWR
jgi:hypothetical protein